MANVKDETIRTAKILNSPRPLVELLQVNNGSWDMLIEQMAEACPEETKRLLIVLAENKSWVIRYHVARHPRTPIDALTGLAKDGDSVIRAWVAGNSNTPTKILKALSKDSNSNVRYWAQKNPNFS